MRDSIIPEAASGADAVQAAGLDPAATLKRLTPVQRGFVRDGCIHGDFRMRTVEILRGRGLFHLVIDSPNGRWGIMRLTALGEAVQAVIKAADGAREAASTTDQSRAPGTNDLPQPTRSEADNG